MKNVILTATRLLGIDIAEEKEAANEWLKTYKKGREVLRRASMKAIKKEMIFLSTSNSLERQKQANDITQQSSIRGCNPGRIIPYRPSFQLDLPPI
jgi:hypothetical protein